MNWIIKNFLRGLVIVVPIAITIYVVVEAFLRIDRLLELRTPGLGFALTILVIVAVGALATNIVGRTLLRMTETVRSEERRVGKEWKLRVAAEQLTEKKKTSG